MNMDNLIADIMNAPNALYTVQTAQNALVAEAKRRHEFREWVDETMKAEFINGEAVVHSPVKKKHLDVTRFLGGLLNIFSLFKQLGTVWTEKAMISLTRNDYEPDIVFLRRKRQRHFNAINCFFLPPILWSKFYLPKPQREIGA